MPQTTTRQNNAMIAMTPALIGEPLYIANTQRATAVRAKNRAEKIDHNLRGPYTLG
jgi:hypothetical protein